jgi:hypothetical protein
MTNIRFKALMILLAMSGCAQLATAETPPPVCCTATEVQTLGDLNYLARAALNHTGEYKDRLYTLAMQLKAGTWNQWNDPDRGYILGLMAATPDGQYGPNRQLLNEFAAIIGVTVKNVSIPTPSPVVVVPPPVSPPVVTAPSNIEDAIRAIVRDELRKAGGITALTNNVIDGNLVVRGKLCVVDGVYATGCDMDKAEQVQIRQAKGAAIGFNANLDNTWRQGDTPNGTGPGYIVMGVSPDLGWRVCQNQAWSVSGYKEYIIAKGKGCFGFDSQANFSIQQCPYGETCLAGQSVVLLKQPYGWVWTAWQRGIPVCLQMSKSTYAAMDGTPLCTQ